MTRNKSIEWLEAASMQNDDFEQTRPIQKEKSLPQIKLVKNVSHLVHFVGYFSYLYLFLV
ncbi:MAG TPA: hypothetical protein VEL11_17075 [Candidatus Bathyarchaeia archaeon]|nr:hypothetical protein [Candidatus Bathyarchaeia archaeon]